MRNTFYKNHNYQNENLPFNRQFQPYKAWDGPRWQNNKYTQRKPWVPYQEFIQNKYREQMRMQQIQSDENGNRIIEYERTKQIPDIITIKKEKKYVCSICKLKIEEQEKNLKTLKQEEKKEDNESENNEDEQTEATNKQNN